MFASASVCIPSSSSRSSKSSTGYCVSRKQSSTEKLQKLSSPKPVRTSARNGNRKTKSMKRSRSLEKCGETLSKKLKMNTTEYTKESAETAKLQDTNEEVTDDVDTEIRSKKRKLESDSYHVKADLTEDRDFKNKESILENKENRVQTIFVVDEFLSADNVKNNEKFGKDVQNNDKTISDKHRIGKKSNNSDTGQCDICGQFLNSSGVIYFQGHPQDAVEELIALANDKLVLSAGDKGDIMERPQTIITGFSIFDKHGHLCPLDIGLIENDVPIYMSGYLKSICSDCPDIDDESIPVKDVGPIIAWFIQGFDGGVKNCITLSTEFGEYNLWKPSEEYILLMNNLYEKIWLSKVVVEYLQKYHDLLPTYEDLLKVLREAAIPELDDMKMSEEVLQKHAQFLCDQVVSLETEKETHDPLITLPCMKELIKRMGIKFGKLKVRTKINYKKIDKKPLTKATTTQLVRKTFESFFTNQLDKTNQELVLRKKRCGICKSCQLPDCGECNACQAMAKFGGHGRTKKACVRKLCPNIDVQQADDSDPDDEEEYRQMSENKIHDSIDYSVQINFNGTNDKKIKWIGEPIKVDATKLYYDKVEIEGAELKIGDYVMVETALTNIPALVAKVVYIWKQKFNPKAGYFHGEAFIRSSDTVLGEVGNPREVFLGNQCCHGAPLSSILRKASVERRATPEDWFKLGGKEVEDHNFEDDGKTYFYNKFYEMFTARFEDLPLDPICPNEARKHRFCPSCERKTRREMKCIPKVSGKLQKTVVVKGEEMTEWSLVKWQDNDYKKGSAVFLKPGTFKFKRSSGVHTSRKKLAKPKLHKVDEDVYPEHYRKSDLNLRGSNVDTRKPFCIGFIAAVLAKVYGALIDPQDIYLSVNIMYRPENTTSRFPQHEDLNIVYWSEEIREISFSAVVGPCQLIYEKNIPQQDSIHDWLERDPNRFYFRMGFDDSSGKFVDVPPHATTVGCRDKGKDTGKGKSKSIKSQEPNNVAKLEDVKVRPLRTLDVFAGCGGLSEGLHQAGVADCRWAIENVEPAAQAYSLNNTSCKVFHEDCNALLKYVMSGATHNSEGVRLPMQGEVELLCGGPPCQGFSGMNRFNSREYSNFKNSLVASYLSFCDYYRPKYFILENVRNFVAFKKGMVLKLTLRTLLGMGYQCTFGIVQAGSYGVPQTRRRLIILAAAPGYNLPMYPEPTHVFSRRACFLTATIDGKRFFTNIQWDHSAPRRTCTIHDAMSDLPVICNGANKTEIEYGSMPESHFQRNIRSKDETAKLRDHICKNMAPLIQARISRIPTTPGSDWRDLPNTSVTLSDGTKCKVLQYRHEDKKNGRSSTGAQRGVCACAAGGACSPQDKQENTLIPWCLPHTGNRHNNWAGLYGRLSWDGYFSTTVTDPEPMGKQGRVLHPTQHRVVSVRECARSQGFRDTYLFAGSVQDKHRQIGNAVPPPLAAALGREIKKALVASTSK